VRPFRSLSADPAQAYFAAGVTEEIRGQLSQVSSLRLLSRNALEAPAATDPAKIVRDLGVTQLVDGSVRLEGKRVRVAAELVDASTQQTLWSDQYDRDIADVLAVQSEVALQIARALSANLSPAEQQRLGQAPTTNAEAYRLYLEARPAPTFDRVRNLAAIELLRKAVALDPRFAMAHATIGFRQVVMGYYDAPSNVDEGIMTTQTALKLNPSLPFAHFVLGTGHAMKGEGGKGRLAFLRALELDPNNTSAMANLSVLESNFGRPGEGLVWARRMFALSGRRGNDFYHLVVPLITLRADNVARRTLLEGERRHPDFPRIQLLLSALEYYEGRTEEAIRRLAKIQQRWPDNEELKFMRADYAHLTTSADFGPALDALEHGSDSSNTIFLPMTLRLRRGHLLRQRGRDAEAAALFAQAEKLARERMNRGDGTPSLRVEMAAIAALRSDHAAAFAWLEQAFDAGYRDYGVIDREPILLTVKPQARFRGILEKMRRDLEVQRTQAEQGGLLNVDPLLRGVK
jgi:TolB-like protein